MKTLIFDLFEDAIRSGENLNSTGSINWDFVCADVFMGLRDHGVDTYNEQEEIQSQIDAMIDDYLELV